MNVQEAKRGKWSDGVRCSKRRKDSASPKGAMEDNGDDDTNKRTKMKQHLWNRKHARTHTHTHITEHMTLQTT